MSVGDGGSPPLPRAALRGDTGTASASDAVVGLLGLSDLVESAGMDIPTFRLGLLYPYSGDLRDICTRFEAFTSECPDAAPILLGQPTSGDARLSAAQFHAARQYLAAIGSLHERIAFAAGPAATGLERAYRTVGDAIVQATGRPWNEVEGRGL